MSEHNETEYHSGRTTPAVKYVTWSAILGFVPVLWIGLQIHKAYIEWHFEFADTWAKKHAAFYTREESDLRFAKNDSVVSVSEASSLKKSVEQVKAQQALTNQKVDSLLISSSVQLVIAAQLRVDRLNENRQPTQDWQSDYAKAKADLTKAEEYRDCLTQVRSNCESLRVW